MKCLNPWDVQSKHVQPSKNQGGMAIVPSVMQKSYGVVSKGNGDAFISEERHTALSTGGGEAGQGYPCVMQPTAGMRGNNQPVICLQGNGIDRADTAGCNGKGWNDQTCYTLNTIDRPAVAYSFDSLASNSMKSSNPNSGCREVTVAKTLDTSDPNPSKNQGGIAVVQAAGFCPEQSAKTRGIGYEEEEEAPTLRAGVTPAVVYEPKSLLDENWSEADTKNALRAEASKSSHAVVQELYDARGNGNGKIAPAITGDHENRVTDYTSVVVESPVLMDAYQHHGWRAGDTCGTLTAGQNDSIRGDTPVIVGFREGSFGGYVEGEVGTLKASGGCLAGGPETLAVQTKPQYIVRRLTPLECERLQGFPDGWTDIGEWTDSSGKRKQTTDSARYKALGNSIAIPPWTFVLSNLILWCGADVTMASLFDGIGGFPLIWNRLGGETLWASEIEEFPIAVTKLHFQEETQ